ncbi:MAG: DUF6504 family protein [Verrucomicrobiota bacterium]
MSVQLVSESIEPVMQGGSAGDVIPGAPVMPAKFLWRGTEHVVGVVIETWKETGACTHGSGERYVRKHWFRIRTTRGDEMKIYFERKPRSGREVKKRWWLYTFISSKE